MTQYQTPHKDHHARPSATPKLSTRLSKKNIPKKSLTTAFSKPIAEDVQVKSSVNTVDSSPISEVAVDSSPISVISEVSEVNRDAVISQISFSLPESAPLALAENVFTSDFSPSPVSTITDMDDPGSVSWSGVKCDIAGSKFASVVAGDQSSVPWSVAKCNTDELKFASIGAEVVVSFLRQARTQVMDSAGVDAKSKKLLDALLEIVVKDFNTVPEENDKIAKILCAKYKIVFVWLLLLIIVMIVLVFNSEGRSTYCGPLPT